MTPLNGNDPQLQEREKFVLAFNDTMLKIWREQKRCCQVARLDLWVQKRGEVIEQSLVLGVEKALIVVAGRDKRRERHALEVGFDGSGSSDFGDANRQRCELS